MNKQVVAELGTPWVGCIMIERPQCPLMRDYSALAFSHQESPRLGGGCLRRWGTGFAGNCSREPVEALDVGELPQPLPVPKLWLQIPSAEVWWDLRRGQAEGEASVLVGAPPPPPPPPSTLRIDLTPSPTRCWLISSCDRVLCPPPHLQQSPAR